MATKKTAIPGATDDIEPQAEAKELPADLRAVHMGIPDFRNQSVAAAIRWFADNPSAPKRNVLTAEGWYVHPELPQPRASALR